MTYVLGISAFYHDSAACLIKDGEIIAAAQEERFSRKKHDSSFPYNAIQFCIKDSRIKVNEIDYVAFYDKPFLKFERLLETYLAFAPKGFKSFSNSMPLWIKDKLFQKTNITKELNEILGNSINWDERLLFSEHHLSHAASAFFPSPFTDSAVLTMDGVGEWTTTSLAIGNKNNLSVHKEIFFPHSIGLLYSAFTYYTGFKVNSGEYKVMGLAPYGQPKYANLIKDNLIDIKDDGSFHLNMSYFDYCIDLKMTNDKFNQLFGGKPRISETDITQKEMDIAASIQKITEEIVVKLSKDIHKVSGQRNLCLAGGVALNCVANGILLKENIFDNIWIQPAAGDAGGALGAALGAYYIMLNKERRVQSSKDEMKGGYLGPNYHNTEIIEQLEKHGAKFRELDDLQTIEETAKALSKGMAVGLMNGKMEFGPRALGARSIIADPRSPKMQKQLNLKVKYRESFRPFAPSILFEDLNDWFDLDTESPYMLLVSNIREEKKIKMNSEQANLFGIDKLNIPRSEIPAVTHVDYTARIQTVHKDTNKRFHQILSKFKEITGCPVLVNTSFNVRGEPIVCSPSDAFRCFMGTELDMLVIENFILFKDEQDIELLDNYKDEYELD
tara:strand:- start:1257 stop:3098 length:1842 start_codon:yes stop_codon:yes gene_type:complete